MLGRDFAREHSLSSEMLNPPQRLAYKGEHLLGVHRCFGVAPEDAPYDTGYIAPQD